MVKFYLGWPSYRPWRSTLVMTALLSLMALAACGGDDDEGTETERPAEEPRHGLTADQAAEVLAEIGDETITLGEFAERLADQSPYLRARFNSPERRREFLDNMIRFELLAQEAERRGLDELPSVVRTRNRGMIQQMMRELFEDRIRLEDVTEADIAAYYNAHESEFHSEEQVRASVLVYPNETAAAAVLAELKANADDMELFRARAGEQPDAARAERRGDVGFFSVDGSHARAALPPSVAAAAFGLDHIGDLHQALVEADGSFWIVKLTGRRGEMNRTLEEASRPIRQRLWSERRDTAIEEFVAELRSASDVEVDESALAHVRIPEPSSNTPSAPEPDPSTTPTAPSATGPTP